LLHLVFAFAFQPGGGYPHAWCGLIAPTRMTLMFWVDFAVHTGVKSTRNHFGHWRLSFWVDFAVHTGVKSTRNLSDCPEFRSWFALFMGPGRAPPGWGHNRPGTLAESCFREGELDRTFTTNRLFINQTLFCLLFLVTEFRNLDWETLCPQVGRLLLRF